ncbi:ribonuclease T2 family protein [Medicago truncatula]|uniref:Ribonuclease T2 family protein n=1 Tax=Medicago truncatula TaxID=3880 RepID=G7L2T4_MEDTR|nr:ribonuclease T2 family protein [Medicago truncatula]
MTFTLKTEPNPQYDFLKLVLQWPPTTCLKKPCTRHQNNFTVHGHEWVKHGTCSTFKMLDYFTISLNINDRVYILNAKSCTTSRVARHRLYSWTRLYGIEPLPEVVEPIGVVKNRDIFYLNIDEEVERLVLKKDMNVVKWLFIMKVFFQSEKYIYS